MNQEFSDEDMVDFNTEAGNSPDYKIEDFPSLESTNVFIDKIKVALTEYELDNPGKMKELVARSALQSMLQFPYSWLKSQGREDVFLKLINQEAETLLATTQISLLIESGKLVQNPDTGEIGINPYYNVAESTDEQEESKDPS